MDLPSIILGAIIGFITSWIITAYFYKRSGKDVEKKLDRQTDKLSSLPTLNNFEKMLRTSEWDCEEINHEEVWVCKKNRHFQFKRSEDRMPFREKWTSVFPDQNGAMYQIHLMISGSIIKSFRFISGDGGRYTLPLPDVAIVNGEQVFCWYKDELDSLIAEVIGSFYRCNSLAEVARFTKVELVAGKRPDF